MEKADAVKDQLDRITTDFTSSSIATALYHAFLLISRGGGGPAASDRVDLTLDTLESAVIWRLPAAKQAQVWLTAYLPQDAVDPCDLYDRLTPGIQVLVDAMSLEGICGYQPAGPVVRLKSSVGYLGAHVGVYWSDQARDGGVYAFVHSAADVDEWGWAMKGLGWRLRPVVNEGEVVFLVESAGEGGPGGERGRYLSVVDVGVARWVGVTGDMGPADEKTYWRVLPSLAHADQVVLQHFAPKSRQGQAEMPMYLSVASQARRDPNSVYLEVSAESPVSFDMEMVNA
ncbi:hypothetical protein BCR44DRAFT_1437937 [Catenaria anguillulae PL171]|uniref:Uncharacterized protein n=1 Tax=Catenaria anguillulae PL171 TaxID=765915 RepID=A0A1Y2HGL6_9FUNG|nr:hypothetical protein BCR44DRAFT_1437937 [Catenaria anguillulae PL171]